jgi:hypothetical protein
MVAVAGHAVKKIRMNSGTIILVDDNDYEMLSKFTWHEKRGKRTSYAVTGGRRFGGGRRLPSIPMHRMLLLPDSEYEVDHINGNGLDNRRCNLRLVTKAQQQWNQHVVRNRSGFHGVVWHSTNKAWAARTTIKKKQVWFGAHYRSPEEAAAAYDANIRSIRGEYARLNGVVMQ